MREISPWLHPLQGCRAARGVSPRCPETRRPGRLVGAGARGAVGASEFRIRLPRIPRARAASGPLRGPRPPARIYERDGTWRSGHDGVDPRQHAVEPTQTRPIGERSPVGAPHRTATNTPSPRKKTAYRANVDDKKQNTGPAAPPAKHRRPDGSRTPWSHAWKARMSPLPRSRSSAAPPSEGRAVATNANSPDGDCSDAPRTVSRAPRRRSRPPSPRASVAGPPLEWRPNQ